MPPESPRSLRHEYELHLDREIEAYKNTVSRAHLCRVADAAQEVLDDAPQLGIREVLLALEVNRQIVRRLEIPSFETWSRRRLRNSHIPTHPECWGLRADTPLQHALQLSAVEDRVLVNGARVESVALYLAANGCQVVVVEPEPAVVERILVAADERGLLANVRAVTAELYDFRPDRRLAAVVCTPTAFVPLAAFEREDVVGRLQRATKDGGVHIFETIVLGQESMAEAELRRLYSTWDKTFDADRGSAQTCIARKPLAARVAQR